MVTFDVYKFANIIAEVRRNIEDTLIGEGYFKEEWVEKNIYDYIQPVVDYFFDTLLNMTEYQYYDKEDEIDLESITEEQILFCALRYWSIVENINTPDCLYEDDWKELVLDKFSLVIDYLIDELIPDRKIEYEDYLEMGLDSDEEKLKVILGFYGDKEKNKYWMDLEKEVDDWLQTMNK